MKRKDFFKTLGAAVLVAPGGSKAKSEGIVKTVRLRGAEKLHLEDLYPIDPNLPKREGSYLTDGDGKYYIWHDGKWNDYWEVKGHLHRS